mmetsp:Transcript_28128/g.40274  ORF Transcript_28128/g.40274 Transcript_28128/m.40274 type:complete len:208 (-) Transcript_28128:26-649(-)
MTLPYSFDLLIVPCPASCPIHHVHHMANPVSICSGSTKAPCSNTGSELYRSLVTTAFRNDMDVITAATSMKKYTNDMGVDTCHVSLGSIFIIAPGTGGSSFITGLDISGSSGTGGSSLLSSAKTVACTDSDVKNGVILIAMSGIRIPRREWRRDVDADADDAKGRGVKAWHVSTKVHEESSADVRNKLEAAMLLFIIWHIELTTASL